MDTSRFQNVGGTPGGLGEFVIGLAMAAAGAYLLLNQVTVMSTFWSLFGFNAFGLALLPMCIGVAFLFFNGRSVLGWLLVIAGGAIIFVGILMHMHLFFRPTTLFNTLVMLVLLFGGLGLVARSLRPHGPRPAG